MLRYIYLLCLIIIINFEFVFCYNYMSESVGRDPGHRRRAGRVSRRQAGFEERPLQQIDVASFILSPDEAGDSNRLASDEFYTERSYSYEAPMRALRRDVPYPGAMANAAAAGAARHDGLSRHQQLQIRRRHLEHDSKKKSAFSKIFPFFSHNKSDSSQPKKCAKNKICVGTCSKKAKEQENPSAETQSTDLHREQVTQKQTTDGARIEKRFAEQICPKCRKKFMKLMHKRLQPQVTHNSRQYFANNLGKDVSMNSQFKHFNRSKRLDKDNPSPERRKKREALVLQAR